VISYEYHHVPISELQTDTYPFSYPPSPSPSLLDTLEKVGILSPLLIIQDEQGLHLLDGQKRLRAWRKLEKEEVPVAICPLNSPHEILQLWIHSQQATRKINPFEIALLVEKGPHCLSLSTDELLHFIQRELRPSVPHPTISSLPSILRLPERLKQEALHRSYSPSFLLKIASTFPKELLTSAASLLESFSLSENHMELLLSWIDEISRRDHRSPDEVLSSDPLPFLLRHPKMPSAKKRDAFLKTLYHMRFPQKSQLEKTYQEIKKKIEGVGSVRLHPPKDFMGDRFELRMTFRDSKELEKTLKRLQSFTNDFKPLFHLL